jgi:guanine deaminase
VGENRFMRRAIALSLRNVRRGGGPFAAVVVKGGRVIAEGANRVTVTNDPTAHAEVVAIRRACARLGHFELRGCDLYTSCEPCPMCLGAIYWARPARVFFANTHRDAARIGFDDSLIYREMRLSAPRRRLKMIAMPGMRQEALAAFDAWRRKANKIVY